MNEDSTEVNILIQNTNEKPAEQYGSLETKNNISTQIQLEHPEDIMISDENNTQENN